MRSETENREAENTLCETVKDTLIKEILSLTEEQAEEVIRRLTALRIELHQG